MKISLTFLLCVFLNVCSFSQDPYHKIFTIEDGLPSNELYQVHFDENNMMWITTDRGICKYDSYEFTSYSTKDGLAYPTNFKIFEDTKDRLWFTGFNGHLTILENDTFRPYEQNEPLQANFNNGNFAAYLGFDQEEKMYVFGQHQQNYYKHAAPFVLFDRSGNQLKESIAFDTIAQNEEGTIFFEKLSLEKNPIYRYGNRPFYVHGVIQHKGEYIFFVNRTLSVELAEGYSEIFYTQNGKIIKLYETKNQLNGIYKDSLNNIFLTSAQGLIFFKDVQDFDNRKLLFKDKFLLNVNQDHEGNYWLTSRSGLYFIPTFAFEEYSQDKSPVKYFSELPSHLIFLEGRHSINGLDTTEYKTTYFYDDSRELRFLFSDENSVSTITAFYALTYEDSKIKTYTKESGSNLDDVQWLRNGQFKTLTGLPKILARLKIWREGHNYQALIDPTSNEIWIGYLNGLTKYSTVSSAKILDIGAYIPELNQRISRLTTDSKNRLWVSTIGGGIFCTVSDTTLVMSITEEDGLSSDLINSTFLENDSTLWVATNNGLNKVEIDIIKNKVKSIDLLTNEDGLNSNFINDFIRWNNKYWIATNYGLSSFDLSHKIGLAVKPTIVIDNVTELKEKFTIEDKQKLKSYQNDIVFNYTGIAYRKPNKDIYSYRLTHDSKKEDWRFTDNRSLVFNNLESGDYLFELKSRNKYNEYSNVIQHRFCIKPHFTDTIWFSSICILSLLLAIILLYKFRMRVLQKRYEESIRLNAAILKKDIAELSTFRNQFNPHFVFNYLNSIQTHVFNGNVREANFYISKFSKLIREGLNLMNSDLIEISRELQYMSDYLELEKNRFPSKFEFNVINKESIPLDQYLIPPLILQPVLENILKHAFSVKSNGKIIIDVSEDKEDNIVIKIIDNGKGIDEKKIESDYKKESFGLKITNDRINLLNLQNTSSKASFKIFSNKDNQTGTTAIFVFPKVDIDV